MIPLLLVAGAHPAEVQEAWVRASPAEIAAAGASFAEGTREGEVRVVGPPEAIRRLGGVPVVAATTGYAPTPEEVEARLEALAAASGGEAEVVDLGASVAGRPLVGLRIGRGSRALRVLGGHHGDEGSSVVVALAVAEALVADPTRRPADTEVWVVPAVNPDGLAAGTRHNLDEVDLNRNYGWMWSAEAPYSGPSAFSEPETRAIRALSRARGFLGGLSLHSGATNLGWVWNWTTETRAVDEPLLTDLAATYAETCTVPGFWITNGADWYPTRGDTTDWTYGQWGALDYTLELTTEKSPPADLVDTYVADHLDAILALLAQPATVDTTVVDAASGAPIPARLTGDDLAPTWSGPDGALSRWYTGDPSTLRVEAPGYADGALGAPLVPLPRPDVLPEPRVLSRSDGPATVHLPGFGDGPLTLSQPGETDLTLPALAPDTWEVDPRALASGAWTLSGDGGVLPRALFVGEVADRVALEEVHVDGALLVLRGHGFGRGSEAWALTGAERSPTPLVRLGATTTTLVFAWPATAHDLLLWTNGAWLAAADVDTGAPAFDHTPPSDTGAPVAEETEKTSSTCSTADVRFFPASTMLIPILWRRRKKI